MPKYTVITAFRGPNVSTQKGVRLEFKEFREGQEVNGEPYTPKPTKGLKHIPTIIVDGSFLIPQNHVKPKFTHTVNLDTSSVDAGETINVTPVDEKVKDEIKDSISGNLDNINKTKMIGYKTGGIVGGALGFATAYRFHKSFLVYTVIGAVAGGYIGYLISTASDKNKQEFKKL